MDEIGKRFGRWTVISEIGRRANGQRRVKCRCDCGHIYTVTLARLLSGMSTECRHCFPQTHGATCRGSKHPEYNVWWAMVARCTKPSNAEYKNYGGRGILVCKEWLGRGGYAKFIGHIGRRPTTLHQLDRTNNNGHYEPGNVRWVPISIQNSNTRRNHIINYGDASLTITQWAAKVGIHPTTLRYRLNKGWPLERALTKSV